MRHPSLTCRAGQSDPDGNRCPAPATAWLAAGGGAVGGPALITVRPVDIGRPEGTLLCAEHLHARIDRLLLAATPAPEARP